jgi:flagellar biosynthesis protein FlhA
MKNDRKYIMNQVNATTFDRIFAPFAVLTANRDLVFAAGICLILAMLFVPLPAILLDFGLTLSFAISILVLMVALWVKKPLEFSAFPTLLLVVTLLRVALNVASSRLILSQGHTGTDAAGEVIQGVANFAIGGDFVIGVVVFVILIVINFIVITKGSGRIAEVSARFSLDSMPGKQMAIDAELGAGAIDETEARIRRKEVEGESSFFGAMDGAAKFVRGDAVAGIIITLVNIVGGILMGAMRHDMGLGDAMQVYTILTIGDGLVTQIPALIVSIAAGLIISKSANEGAASEAVIDQLGSSPKALYVAAGLIALLGILPGFPMYFFFPVAAIMAAFGMMADRTIDQDADAAEAASKAKNVVEPTEQTPGDLIKTDAIRLDLGSGLVMLISDADAALPGKVLSLRKLFATDFGFILPSVRIKDDSALNSDAYSISIHGVSAASGEVVIGSRLLIDPTGAAAHFPGRRVKEPTFGLDAVWIDEARASEAEAQGFTVVDCESVIITHLTEVIKGSMPDLMTYGVALELMKSLDKDYQRLVTDTPNPSPVILLQNVVQNLLSERVSIRNLPHIAEAVAEAGAVSKNPVTITEHVRRRLSAQICDAIEDDTGFLPVVVLGKNWTQEFAASIKSQDGEHHCYLSPKRVQDFVLASRVELQKFAARDEWPALLVSPEARPIVRSMLERVSMNTQVISHAEIHRNAKLKTVATIGD